MNEKVWHHAVMGEKTMMILKTLVFAVLVPGTVVLLFPYLLSTRFPIMRFHLGEFRFGGLIPVLFGAVICLRCAWDFVVIGEGTPAPIDPPKKLVVEGFYLYVRNPMYIGITTILLGEAIVLESVVSLLYCIFIFMLFHAFVVFYEEPVLREKFGKNYEEYISKVPRWIPKVGILFRHPDSNARRIRL